MLYCRNSELFQLLEVAGPEELLRSSGELFTASRADPERRCFLAQKLASGLPSIRSNYGVLSHATQAR